MVARSLNGVLTGRMCVCKPNVRHILSASHSKASILSHPLRTPSPQKRTMYGTQRGNEQLLHHSSITHRLSCYRTDPHLIDHRLESLDIELFIFYQIRGYRYLCSRTFVSQRFHFCRCDRQNSKPPVCARAFDYLRIIFSSRNVGSRLHFTRGLHRRYCHVLGLGCCM